jgi:integrase
MARTTKMNAEAPARKRGHGESTIVQRPDGSWMGQVSFPNAPDGKRVRKTIYGKTRAETVKKVKELEALRTAGEPVPTKDVTVEMLMTRWLGEVVKPSLKASTYRSYEQMVRNHIIPASGKQKVCQIDIGMVDKFLQAKLQPSSENETALSPQTVRYLRGLLRRAWRFGMKWGWVRDGTNMITLSEPISVRREKTLVLTGEELPELLEAFSDRRDEALFTTALGLGLRFGEVLGLRWQDIDIDPDGGGTASIRFQLQRIDSKLQLTLPKSESSQRTLFLPQFVSDALEGRRETQDQEQLLCGEFWDNSLGLVFTNKDGGPLDPSRVRKRFKRVMKDCPQGKLRLHDLRHIAASILLGEGISATDTASQLGHADPYLVMRTYGHAMLQGKREAAGAMDKAFAKRRIQP